MVVLSGVDVCIAYPAMAQRLTYLGQFLYHHTDSAWITNVLIPGEQQSASITLLPASNPNSSVVFPPHWSPAGTQHSRGLLLTIALLSHAGLYNAWVIMRNLWSNQVGLCWCNLQVLLHDHGNLQSNPVDFAGITTCFLEVPSPPFLLKPFDINSTTTASNTLAPLWYGCWIVLFQCKVVLLLEIWLGSAWWWQLLNR